jgi:hypothetical protein
MAVCAQRNTPRARVGKLDHGNAETLLGLPTTSVPASVAGAVDAAEAMVLKTHRHTPTRRLRKSCGVQLTPSCPSGRRALHIESRAFSECVSDARHESAFLPRHGASRRYNMLSV